jgi:hypothetical protein
MRPGWRAPATTCSAWRLTSADSASRTTPLSGKGMEVRSASGGAALVTRHAPVRDETWPRLAPPSARSGHLERISCGIPAESGPIEPPREVRNPRIHA